MDVRRFGRWLALLAIALHAAWPLLANAKPKSAHLVPLCTVEGVTHYIEVPGGTPLDDSAKAHQDHCSFCFLGVGGLVASHIGVPLRLAITSQPVALGVEHAHTSAVRIILGARAPPFPPAVTDHNFGRQDETDIFAGRVARALYG